MKRLTATRRRSADHVVLLSDAAEPSLDTEQMVSLPLEFAFQLRPKQQQHPAQ
jgi:hypothetical protein